MTLDSAYWSKRYLDNAAQWDIGYAAPALVDAIDAISNKQSKLLIPGCGNAYEAVYAYQNGYTNTFIIDWALEPLALFKKNHPFFPENQVLHGNFFEHQSTYDVIIEQTFFCALTPDLRPLYVSKCASLLHVGGALKGLLFNRVFEQDGPPFGGNSEEYRQLFEPYFTLQKMDLCTQSIEPRQGAELYIEFIKKPTP